MPACLATRFEVATANLALADLFRTLAIQEEFPEYTIEKATLESMFLKVIRENNDQEEDQQRHTTHCSSGVESGAIGSSKLVNWILKIEMALVFSRFVSGTGARRSISRH